MSDKNTIRKAAILRRNQLSLEEKADKDKRILEKLLSLEPFQKASTVLCYVSYKSEVDTHAIIQIALNLGKRVACPLCGPLKGEMNFYEISSFADLKEGYQGILEPKPLRLLKPDENTVMLIPGLLFDDQLYRLGYGGGFYDRYLEKYRDVSFYKIGLFYAFQHIAAIPTDSTDEKMDLVLTED